MSSWLEGKTAVLIGGASGIDSKRFVDGRHPSWSDMRTAAQGMEARMRLSRSSSSARTSEAAHTRSRLRPVIS